MIEEKSFECQSCKRTVLLKKSEPVPTCCGKPMQPVPDEICRQPAHPEHARPMEDEDACDEFRAGYEHKEQ